LSIQETNSDFEQFKTSKQMLMNAAERMIVMRMQNVLTQKVLTPANAILGTLAMEKPAQVSSFFSFLFSLPLCLFFSFLFFSFLMVLFSSISWNKNLMKMVA